MKDNVKEIVCPVAVLAMEFGFIFACWRGVNSSINTIPDKVMISLAIAAGAWAALRLMVGGSTPDE